VHIKSLGLPESKKDKTASSVLAEAVTDASTREATDEQAGPSKIRQPDDTVVPNVGERESKVVADDEVTWDNTFESSLSPFLPESSLVDLKKMYIEGPEPPRVSDSGWVSRLHNKSEDVEISEQDALPHQDSGLQSSDSKRGKHQNTRGGRGRQRDRGGRSQGSEREDHRKVLSEVCYLARQFCHFSRKRCSLSAQRLRGRLFTR
jgi:tRNA pseudouridine13 synthase